MIETIELLFFKESFSDLSMDEIAQALSMKKASLYYHFPSKEAMFLSVLEYSYAQYRSDMQNIFQEPSENWIEEILLYGSKQKNLFAVVSQKGYCKIATIKEAIKERLQALRAELIAILLSK